MSAGRVAARVGRLASAKEAAALDAEIRRVAQHVGILEGELRAEVDEVDRICREAGAVTVADRVAAVARDLGVPAAWLRAEAERLQAAFEGSATPAA